MPTESEAYARVAHEFAVSRARNTALITQAQAWTGVAAGELGTFDTVTPLDGAEIGNVYARLVSLSVQRLRVLSGQLDAAYAEHGVAAFVRDRQAYNPATREVEVIGEDPTALAKLENEERDRLKDLLALAVRLELETHAASAVKSQGKRMAALAQALCEAAGMDWTAEETRRLAQRAVLTAEGKLG